MTDVTNDAVSVEAARKFYGVVIENGSIDLEATEKERYRIRTERLGKIPTRSNGSRKQGNSMRRVSKRLLIDPSNNVVCENCGHVVGPSEENYKSNLVRKENSIQEANPLIVDPKLFIDPEVVFRQYFCPACATQIETEVLLATSEPVWDKQIGIT